MNKTLKRQVFRHTALYAAILMFSHTGGGGGAMAQTREYAIIMNGRNQPEVKSSGPFPCPLYNSTAADDQPCVIPGVRSTIKKK
ncbi:hypothetical protein, partial [Neisseria gonorrhoeae]|uniref:hypothetical protein n=1 Tax=Neisseria gonorrhoeae TaxID=485 RepID=UPI001BFE3220